MTDKPEEAQDRELRMLEIIERSPNINQRNLAREADMALGLVNSCLKRLIRKGFVKIGEAPGRRYLYYLTPHGFAEKSRLTYEYIRYSVNFYGEARKRCKALFTDLEAGGRRRVAFLGVGDLAEIAYFSLMEFELELVGVFDEHGVKSEFFGCSVRPVIELHESPPDSYDALVYTRMQPPDEMVGKLEFEEIFVRRRPRPEPRQPDAPPRP